MTDTPGYTISGEKHPGVAYLTEAQALACLKIVKDYLHHDADPRLYRDHEGPYWNISYEGDYEWPMRICEARRGQWPDGVFIEPVAGWCLGLYPA